MTDEIRLSEAETYQLAFDFLCFHGLSRDQSAAMAGVLTKAQRDGCLSHGLQRLPGTLETMAHPAFNREAVPVVDRVTPAVVQVDAGQGFSILASSAGLPVLIESATNLREGIPISRTLYDRIRGLMEG